MTVKRDKPSKNPPGPVHAPDLRLPCKSGDDTLVVKRIGDDVLLRGSDARRDTDTFIYLSPEQARDLFNWLGVYLHTLHGSTDNG